MKEKEQPTKLFIFMVLCAHPLYIQQLLWLNQFAPPGETAQSSLTFPSSQPTPLTSSLWPFLLPSWFIGYRLVLHNFSFIVIRPISVLQVKHFLNVNVSFPGIYVCAPNAAVMVTGHIVNSWILPRKALTLTLKRGLMPSPKQQLSSHKRGFF